jgi:hypothetical protein
MPDQTASRTLVKSAPELWAECSEAASLARHLGAFGEIRITKLQSETTVAWEGEAARGTVCLEPSGWGTRVTLTAEEVAVAQPVAEPTQDEPEPPERRGLLSRIFGRRRDPAPEPEPAAPASAEPTDPGDALTAALDSLGQAHHRPYSRG